MKKRTGRPFISGKPKTVKITVMFDDEEHRDLKEKADKENKTLSQYIRDLIKKQN